MYCMCIQMYMHCKINSKVGLVGNNNCFKTTRLNWSNMNWMLAIARVITGVHELVSFFIHIQCI